MNDDADRQTHFRYLGARAAGEEQQLGDEEGRDETQEALAGNVAQRRQQHVDDEVDGERRYRYQQAYGGDDPLGPTELEHDDGVGDVPWLLVGLVEVG